MHSGRGSRNFPTRLRETALAAGSTELTKRWQYPRTEKKSSDLGKRPCDHGATAQGDL